MYIIWKLFILNSSNIVNISDGKKTNGIEFSEVRRSNYIECKGIGNSIKYSMLDIG